MASSRKDDLDRLFGDDFSLDDEESASDDARAVMSDEEQPRDVAKKTVLDRFADTVTSRSRKSRELRDDSEGIRGFFHAHPYSILIVGGTAALVAGLLIGSARGRASVQLAAQPMSVDAAVSRTPIYEQLETVRQQRIQSLERQVRSMQAAGDDARYDADAQVVLTDAQQLADVVEPLADALCRSQVTLDDLQAYIEDRDSLDEAKAPYAAQALANVASTMGVSTNAAGDVVTRFCGASSPSVMSGGEVRAFSGATVALADDEFLSDPVGADGGTNPDGGQKKVPHVVSGDRVVLVSVPVVSEDDSYYEALFVMRLAEPDGSGTSPSSSSSSSSSSGAQTFSVSYCEFVGMTVLPGTGDRDGTPGAVERADALYDIDWGSASGSGASDGVAASSASDDVSVAGMRRVGESRADVSAAEESAPVNSSDAGAGGSDDASRQEPDADADAETDGADDDSAQDGSGFASISLSGL